MAVRRKLPVACIDNGVLICTYRPAGEIKAGSFTFGRPTDAEIETIADQFLHTTDLEALD